MTHVVQIGFFSDPQRRLPEELLEVWPTLADVAESAAAAGAQVSLIQASCHVSTFSRRGVTYHFLPFGANAAGKANLDLRSLIRRQAPELLHVHGLGFAAEVLAVREWFPQLAILLQDHADCVPRFWRRTRMRKLFTTIAGISFCACEQAAPFIDAGLLRPQTPIYEVAESTSRFTPGDTQQARLRTGVHGDPSILWVGHLDQNKDPLTVLAGVSEAVRTCRDLQMWCCFGNAPLLPQVQRRIAADPYLKGRVRLLGRVSHERVEELMRAADVFVLGSHREGSGYALIEAMACGATPAVTDIPSFRALTANGAVGRLWSVGDAHALAVALTSIAASVSPQTRRQVRAHFDASLSTQSLGSQLVFMYRDVMRRERATLGPPAAMLKDEAAGGLR